MFTNFEMLYLEEISFFSQTVNWIRFSIKLNIILSTFSLKVVATREICHLNESTHADSNLRLFLASTTFCNNEFRLLIRVHDFSFGQLHTLLEHFSHSFEAFLDS